MFASPNCCSSYQELCLLHLECECIWMSHFDVIDNNNTGNLNDCALFFCDHCFWFDSLVGGNGNEVMRESMLVAAVNVQIV